MYLERIPALEISRSERQLVSYFFEFDHCLKLLYHGRISSIFLTRDNFVASRLSIGSHRSKTTMPDHSARCVQYFGIYFIITGVAVISIGASETHTLITPFTYSGLTFISCGAFLLLAHSSIKRGARRNASQQRASAIYHTGQDVTVSLEVNLETVRDYLSVSKRSGNAVIVNIDVEGNLTCELAAEENVDPALLAACSIPDMDVSSLELYAQQQQALQKVLRVVRRTSGRHHYEHGKVCTFDDGTVSIYIWHGFNSSDDSGNRRTTDPPPVYADVICIPPIREEEPPSYQDVIVTMETVS